MVRIIARNGGFFLLFRSIPPPFVVPAKAGTWGFGRIPARAGIPSAVISAKAGIHSIRHSGGGRNPLLRHSGEGRNPLSRHSGGGRNPLVFVIPAKAGIQFFVIPAKAGIQFFVIPAEAGIHFDLAFLCSVFGALARTDSRPCAFRPPSMAAGYFSLLAQREVTKRKAPSDPRRSRSERFAAGERVRPTGHPWPVVRIGAIPRAARVRCTRLFRSPFAAAQRGPESKSNGKMDSGFRRNDGLGSAPHICGVVYKRCRDMRRHFASLLRQGLPRSAPPRAPLGRGEQAQDQSRQRWPAGGRPVRPQYMDVLWANPGACSRSLPARMPANRGREGVFLLVTSLWTSKEK